MSITKIWSQGQLFAFSGLDGATDYKNDFTGVLCGDRLGVKFFTKVRRELCVVGLPVRDIRFEAVTGDCIGAVTDGGQKIRFIFRERNLVIGDTCDGSFVTVFAEGPVTTRTLDGITVHDTDDGEFTALARVENRFSFAVGASAEEAAAIAKRGLLLDIDAEFEQKFCYYRQNSIDSEYGELYSKCVSVMKTQIYSPEGRFSGFWSTPDRLPHKALWLWDSVFHAIGHRNLHPEVAEQLILSVFETQRPDGMIPHMSSPYWSSAITQPPVLAWGAWKVYEKSRNKEFLKKVFESNSRFLQWCDGNRRPAGRFLYSWNTADKPDCRCDESGMDNSPRFDDEVLLQTIDFSCFMANEMRFMSRIAAELGQDGACFDEQFEKIKADVNACLWDEADGFYYDLDVHSKTLHKVASVASFLPLFAGVCNEEQARLLVKQLSDPNTFGTPAAIPCLAANHPTFGTDMWRGPVWINYNYMIAEGLEGYGFGSQAATLRKQTVDMVDRWYRQTGTIYEFYDSNDCLPPSKLNRKGPAVEPYDFKLRYQTIRDYGWSCTLTFDLLSPM